MLACVLNHATWLVSSAFATIDNNTFAILPANASDTELYRRTAALKKTNTDLKVFISVGEHILLQPHYSR